jgi:predicted alpha/beta-hydrolase family hydrolase
MFAPFLDESADPPARGFLHEPAESNHHAVLLTHGAGANCQSKLLVEVSNALADSGFLVLRFDLPFRIARAFGPPRPGAAARDRDGLRRAATLMRAKISGHLFLGGHSYGGRQATMLVADEPDVAEGLLLLSYPLHPPRKATELRTEHFPQLSKPAFFVHGARDPFGTIAEMESALELIRGSKALLEVEGAGHELLPKKSTSDLPQRIAREFVAFSKS